MKLILVRHGETRHNVEGRLYGKEDVPLTKAGLKQASKVALRLKKEPIDVIYCSDLKRARQTAAAIAKFHKVHVLYSRLITDRKMGSLAGMPAEEYRQIRDKSGIPPHLYRPHGGENYADMEKRVKKFISSIRKKHSEHTVLIVSHRATIRTLISALTGRHLSRVFELDSHNTAVNIIELQRGKEPKVHYLDSTEHL
jgi:broad specificity phosphatase PhoE